VDVHAKIAQLRQTVDEARSMPMSASVVVNRGELLALVDDLSEELEKASAESERVVAAREALVAEGRQEADGIVADAHREREKLISDTDVFRVAKREADGLVARAREDAEALRQETDQYVDAKLANFEVTLGRTSDAVRRGRERLAGRSSFADLRDPDPSLEDPAWEPSPDRGDG
jgi:cell division septum initiation protein DivIVA